MRPSGLEFSTPEQAEAYERRLRERRLQRQRLAQRRRRRAQIRRNRIIAGLLVGALCWLCVAVALPSASSHILRRTPQPIRLTSLVRSYTVAPGTLAPIAWPSAGEGAISVLGTGTMATSPNQQMVPIASLTKMMTALVVLTDHPLQLGGEGPKFTMTQADVQAWVHASQTDESNVTVQVGEVLTEQQLLEALLIPSADNIADYLASYDAGSIPAFVKKMNAMARSLGLHSTRYADASGVDPASRSTAADQAVIAAKLMGNPVVRSIVSHPSLAFPVAGTIRNYNPALGVDGIIGVKSGYTSQALGCLATAAYRTVGSKSVLVVAVTTGQPDGLYGAARADEALLTRASSSLRIWRPTLSATTIAQAAQGSSVTPLSLGAKVPTIVAWPGLRLKATILANSTAAAGSQAVTPVLGELVLTAPFGVVAQLPLVASASSGVSLPVNGVAADSSQDGQSGSATAGSLAAGG